MVRKMIRKPIRYHAWGMGKRALTSKKLGTFTTKAAAVRKVRSFNKNKGIAWANKMQGKKRLALLK